MAKNTKQKRSKDFDDDNLVSKNDEKNVVRHQKKSGPPVPEVVNMDTLATLLDDELYSHANAMEHGRARAYDQRHDTLPWEQEIAYARREIQIRHQRREAHERYVSALSRQHMIDERNLPYFQESDNRKFMVLNLCLLCLNQKQALCQTILMHCVICRN